MSRKRVLLVEPIKSLVSQTLFNQEGLYYILSFTSAQRLFEDPNAAFIIILDEYYALVLENAYSFRHNCVRGVWELRGKKVFAFQGAYSTAHERLLYVCINEPYRLRLKSEYEIVKGASPVVDLPQTNVLTANPKYTPLSRPLQPQEQHHVIVILEQTQREDVMNIIER